MANKLSKLKIIILGSFGGFAGWLIFNGIRAMFPIDQLHPLAQIGAGVGIIWLLAEFGFKLKKDD